ncbi:hypothetical protein BDN67DRAFT_900429, partial [Paxillus ammoniavirescens]
FVVVFPKFQRTHLTTNACGLLLQYVLDISAFGGIGIRRVQWQASDKDHPSVPPAEKMGFKFEGVFRWDRVMPGDSRGLGEAMFRRGDPTLRRDSAILAMCWDDWEQEGREALLERMDRKI